ncbi:hypothetical protein Slin15195_G110130 [Septoria linicola]|uniref:Uncharacterized protein n=1 Tax=Septoria linicola TaxID=215465 RepID=A0A9Q9AYE0_9PEZI|nr:hypothetical protein Slin14017_G108480 [Septoria linicola]USW57694.1 hypothetical protein Slin15195_G110130 [Septoria linicola]
MLTTNILTCALLAGQYVAAAYLPIKVYPRHDEDSPQLVTVTQVIRLTTLVAPTPSPSSKSKSRKTITRTSTKVVQSTPSNSAQSPSNSPTSSIKLCNGGLGMPYECPGSTSQPSSTKAKTKTRSSVPMCTGAIGVYECANPTAKPSKFKTKPLTPIATAKPTIEVVDAYP